MKSMIMSEAKNVHCSLLMFDVFTLCNFKIKKKIFFKKPIDERKGEVRPMYGESLQLCPTLWDSMNPPGSFVRGILQVRNWSGLPCPPPGDLPNPGIKPLSLRSPALAGGLTTSATWEVRDQYHQHIIKPQ